MCALRSGLWFSLDMQSCGRDWATQLLNSAEYPAAGIGFVHFFCVNYELQAEFLKLFKIHWDHDTFLYALKKFVKY